MGRAGRSRGGVSLLSKRRYLVYECTNRFLLKTDDDSFIHLESLWDLAKSRMVKRSNHLIGFLQLGIKKHHYLPLAHKPTQQNLNNTAWLKWLIPTYMYGKKFFPQFLSGSGYLIPSKASVCLLQKTKVICYYIMAYCGASRRGLKCIVTLCNGP